MKGKKRNERNDLFFDSDGRPFLKKGEDKIACVHGVKEGTEFRFMGKNAKILKEGDEYFLVMEEVRQNQTTPFQDKTPLSEIERVVLVNFDPSLTRNK